MNTVLRTVFIKSRTRGLTEDQTGREEVSQQYYQTFTAFNKQKTRGLFDLFVAYCSPTCDNKYAVDEDRSETPPPSAGHTRQGLTQNRGC